MVDYKIDGLDIASNVYLIMNARVIQEASTGIIAIMKKKKLYAVAVEIIKRCERGFMESAEIAAEISSDHRYRNESRNFIIIKNKLAFANVLICIGLIKLASAIVCWTPD